MKKTLILLSLAALSAVLSGCRQEPVPVPVQGSRTVSVGFSFGNVETKSGEPAAGTFEDAIVTTDIFFFDAESGALRYSQHNSTAAMSILVGNYHVYALANLDKTAEGTAYTSITDEASLTGALVSFGSNAGGCLGAGWSMASCVAVPPAYDDMSREFIDLDAYDSFSLPRYFVMSTDRMDVSATDDLTLTLNLERVASRIVLADNIDFSAYQEHFIEEEVVCFTTQDNEYMDMYASVFLVNVPKVAPLVGPSTRSASTSSLDTYNPIGTAQATYQNRSRNYRDYVSWIPEGVASNGQNSGTFMPEPYVFYCYPNTAARRTPAQIEANPHFTDYTTKLVIALNVREMADSFYWTYYPIAVPDIGRNKTFMITSVKIFGPGADNPWEDPPQIPQTAAMSYSATVVPWTTGSREKIYSGGQGSVDASGNITM